ncbi:MAG TPA: hypothetical protein VFF27_00220 [Bacteroidia bacterium]|jgi:hypothetical protein|nr:hypothetical protein [Bacteroidia bacterium]
MKLSAIYNCWDSEELLKGSIEQIYNSVDLIIIVWQDVSNFGESYSPMPRIIKDGIDKLGKVIFSKYVPALNNGFKNEINKRHLGLEIAKKNSCTHFLHLDCDEYYDTNEFEKAKSYFLNSGHSGSACKMWTYFKNPTFRLDTPEGYHVPFIHKLKSHTRAGYKTYPYYCDPTRRINETDVIELDIMMHHFSWVRENIDRKVNNSSAKSSLLNGTLLKDYHSTILWNTPEGYYIKDFDKRIKLVENKFNVKIPL